STKLRAAIQRLTAEGRLTQLLRNRLAFGIADEVDRGAPVARTRGESKDRVDPQPHAQAVIDAIESRCEALGVYPGLLPAAAVEVAGIRISRAAEQRKAGRLDDARQTTAWLFAFGETLARKYSDAAAFHLVLSLAFEQEAEDARRVEDFVTTEVALS